MARPGEAEVAEPALRSAPEAARRGAAVESAAAASMRPEQAPALAWAAPDAMAATQDPAGRTAEDSRHQAGGEAGDDGPQTAPPRAAPNAGSDAMRAQLRFESGGARLTVAPDELGSVEISVARDEAGLAIHVRADRAESGDLLRRHADLLQRELAEGGVAASRLTFSQSGQDGTQGGRPGHTGEPRRRTGLGGAEVTQPSVVPRAAGVSGRLDLRL